MIDKIDLLLLFCRRFLSISDFYLATFDFNATLDEIIPVAFCISVFIA